MKQQLNKKLKILFLFTVVFFSSCEKDLYEEPIYRERNSKAIQLKDFMRETGIKDFSSVIKVPLSNKNTLSRTATLSDFNIDIDVILKHINESNKVTYSFKINPTSFESQENEKFNLVYMKEGNVWQQSIIAFKQKEITSQNQNLFENIEKLFDSRMANTTMSMNTEVCISEYYYIQCDGSCHGQCDGFACPTGQCIQRYITIDYCGGSGGTNPDSNGDTSNGNGGTNTGTYDPFDFTPNDGSTSFLKTPCQELNKFISNNSIQQTLRILKGQSSGQEEHGNYIKETTNSLGETYLSFPVVPQDTKKPYSIDISAGLNTGNIKGAMHCHTDPVSTKAIPMFSPADLKSLWDIARNHIPANNVPKNFSEYTVMLSVGSGHYALKFKDFNSFRLKFGANFANFEKKLIYLYTESTPEASSETLIENFLAMLSKNNFADSIGLYKATEVVDSNGVSQITSWKEQVLSPNGNVIEIACN